ncbi:DUF2561 family protein [Mycolicibacterium smegmatis]|uniref:Transmembrane protein n=3 Tax=Mycolicibacterium smegmatis TaxID=1772 RepID=A0R053_MYCS2|nr:DUF2561 family protein [Mycolicibacterium smegmatis]ABK74940.1 conserved hypothetical protein [Mycolicibacterium smegmatis MC2 155]AFP40621.1 hypothetical protein MSMEI_4164 [Mycolicibacterium smegmatis MC2 155]AIU09356.1 hypothetical protein LJ00_21140 [Mycolicibacterium smegmatis MC2 155]AIU15981.1 hypothetical protein LI99_21145 [Mycolicibacterium smegmatis]AIU22604.1 hypothetical protein LI98_21150 [Mycolicibacterium smegmatis]
MTSPFAELNTTDRILAGACAVAWLAALGAGVAALVALVDLGRGHTQAVESTETPWLLYTVIGISVLVIAAAIPLLLRARAQADSRPPARSQGPRREPVAPRRVGYTAPTYRQDAVATAFVEKVWLRFVLSVTCALGVATAVIGLGTYLLATDHSTAAWCAYGLAGLVTLGMIALPIIAIRELDRSAA